MKTRKNLISIALLMAGMLMFQLSNAQKLIQKNTNIKVSGTSTLHKWDMTSAQSSFIGNINGNTITDVKFTMKSNSLKSGESAMDKNAYKSLQVTKYPDITFTAESIPESGTATISGNLTITNVTKNIKIPITVTKSGNAYTIKGKTNFKMSAFGVTPPTFMMGTIKTGDDISIDININAN